MDLIRDHVKIIKKYSSGGFNNTELSAINNIVTKIIEDIKNIEYLDLNYMISSKEEGLQYIAWTYVLTNINNFQNFNLNLVNELNRIENVKVVDYIATTMSDNIYSQLGEPEYSNLIYKLCQSDNTITQRLGLNLSLSLIDKNKLTVPIKSMLMVRKNPLTDEVSSKLLNKIYHKSANLAERYVANNKDKINVNILIGAEDQSNNLQH